MKRGRSPSSKAILDAVLPLPTLADWTLLHGSVLALPPTSQALRRSLCVVEEKVPYLKVAAFDLDDTIIMPKTGAVFPRDDPTDWKWLTPAVPGHLRMLHDGGFLVVIFSNQAGIGGKQWNEKKSDAIKRKIILLSKGLNIPLAAFLSTKDDLWRKPNVGMWNILQDYASEINKEKVEIRGQSPRHAFYVGDAAGRKVVTLAGRKRDFSCSDRKFAINIGVPFLTPEQFLSWPEDTLLEDASESQGGNVRAISQRLLSLAQTPCPVDWGGISPVELSSLPRSYEGLTINRITAEGRTGMLTLASPTTFHRDLQEMILFVGYPSCGKTTFFERFLKPHGYVHVNRDKLQTKERCISEATKSWNEGKSVVVDNTNPSHDDCKSFLKIIGLKCSSKGTLPVRLFLFKASKELSMHMSTVRARLGIAPKISRIAFNVFQSKYDAWDARSVKSMNIEELLEIPPVVCFDGLPEGAMREFFMLS